jgi:OmpA-OmpF porin, OOP family
MSAKFINLFNVKNAFAALTLLFIAIFAPVSTFAQQVDTEARITEPMGDAYKAPQKIKQKHVRMTFYRPQQGAMAGVASLEVNGRYHSALQLGSYTELCVAPGRVVVAARMAQIGTEPKGFRDATATLNLQEAQSVYLRLLEQGDGRATITPVRAPIALAELKDTRRQLHVISRVLGGSECLEQTKQMVQKETFVLASDGAFGFGRSDMKGFSSEGRASVDQVVSHIQKKYGNDKSVVINVAGHSDPIGGVESNKRLSQARANTIRAYMIQSGMDPQQINSEGLGSEQLVLPTCGLEPTKENIECNKPNRRVTETTPWTAEMAMTPWMVAMATTACLAETVTTR